MKYKEFENKGKLWKERSGFKRNVAPSGEIRHAGFKSRRLPQRSSRSDCKKKGPGKAVTGPQGKRKIRPVLTKNVRANRNPVSVERKGVWGGARKENFQERLDPQTGHQKEGSPRSRCSPSWISLAHACLGEMPQKKNWCGQPGSWRFRGNHGIEGFLEQIFRLCPVMGTNRDLG